MKLLKPSPEFCIKTSLKGKNDSKFTTKLFINICSTSELQRPTFENSTQGGQKGQSWKLPYITNKPRYDQDKQKKVCTTIDIAFHPHAFEVLPRNPQFEKLLCDTAITSTEKQLMERNEVVSRDYKILKKIKCKGGEPATMTVRGSRLKEDPGKKQEETPQRQTDGDFAPKLFKEFQQKQKENEEKKKEEKEKEKEKLERENDEKGTVIEDLEGEALKNEIECPKYTVFYSYESEYFVNMIIKKILNFVRILSKKEKKNLAKCRKI